MPVTDITLTRGSKLTSLELDYIYIMCLLTWYIILGVFLQKNKKVHSRSNHKETFSKPKLRENYPVLKNMSKS